MPDFHSTTRLIFIKASFATNIGANKTSILTNTSAVTTNATSILANGTSIASNKTNIGTNATDIGNNATDIGTNATKISSNTTDIGSNATDIGSNASKIISNATDIGSNATDIGSNATDIGSNTTNIGSNTTDIGDNAADIGDNATDIGDNTTDIGVLTGDVISTSTTWTVGTSSVADYADLKSAMDAARKKEIRGNAWLTIQIEDGTYSTSSYVLLNHAHGARIKILGNTADPSKVVYEYTGTSNAFDLGYNHMLYNFYGMTIRQTGSATSASGLYVHDGAFIIVGHLVIENFSHYGITIRNQAGMRALTNSLTIQDNGSTGLDVRDGSFFYGDGVQSFRNGAHGIGVSGGCYVRSRLSEMDSNSSNGVYGGYGSQLMVAETVSSNNGKNGFYVYGNSHIRAYEAEADNNAAHGYSASDASIYAGRSLSTNNGTWGYSVDRNSYISGGGTSLTVSGNASGGYNVDSRTGDGINYNIYR